MEKQKSCKYCKNKVDKFSIRCGTCDDAWREGYYDGDNSVRGKLGEIFRALKNLSIKD